MAKMVKEVKKKGCMTQRDVLWILVFVGFGVNYMIRINLNIAIVAMVKPRAVSVESLSTSSECLRETHMANIVAEQDRRLALISDNNSGVYEANTTSFTGLLLNKTTSEQVVAVPKIFEGFDWNEYEQGLILGAFFWLHWSTQVAGGLLAGKYGTKLIYGLSNFTGVLCCFLIPVASYWGWKALIFVRCLQGILAGFAWPAMHNMTAKWIPPNERSKFVTAYLGSSVGAALTFPMCGYIIDLWGWEYVFYVSGILGSLWFTCWWVLVFDTPAQHPRITDEERDYIHECLGQTVAKEKAPVPWRAILTSVPVWMNILAQWGGIWGLFTLMTHAPTYFKYIHGWNIRVTGLLSGMPHMLRMVFAYLFSIVGDYLLRTNKMSRTNVRKLATGVCGGGGAHTVTRSVAVSFINYNYKKYDGKSGRTVTALGTIGQGFCMLALAYSGCNYQSAIVFLTLATAIHGTVSSGPLASFVDISPNYASITLGLANTIVAMVGFITPLITGVCLGICGMIAVLPGFISPAVVGILTYQNQTVGQWQMVFLIAVVMLMISGVAYCLFSKSELEPWNSPDTQNCCFESELKSLKPDKEDHHLQQQQQQQQQQQTVIITEKEKK